MLPFDEKVNALADTNVSVSVSVSGAVAKGCANVEHVFRHVASISEMEMQLPLIPSENELKIAGN